MLIILDEINLIVIFFMLISCKFLLTVRQVLPTGNGRLVPRLVPLIILYKWIYTFLQFNQSSLYSVIINEQLQCELLFVLKQADKELIEALIIHSSRSLC